MRKSLFLFCLVVLLGLTTPAEAQWRDGALEEHAPARVLAPAKTGFSLDKLFDPSHFKMAQSIEFSSSSFSGQASSLGMFTNSMMWQFNDKLAARMDVSVAYSPNAASFANPSGQGSPRVFVRNAEMAYRPNENFALHVSFQQSPYGSYASPYGYYGSRMGGYGYNPFHRGGSFMRASFGNPDNLFWNDRLR